MRKRFGRNDIILISVIVIISVALLLIWKLVYLKGQDTDSDACVEVTIDGRAYGTYPLSKDDTIEIKNGDGDVTNTLVTVSYTHLDVYKRQIIHPGGGECS